jgi:putative flippase GtrA
MASIGRKRRFLLFGALNVALTNLLLQLLLWCGVATGLATLGSQLLNLGLGYLLYGMHVFRVASLQGRSALAYAALALLLWCLNWGGINGLAVLGWPRNWAALSLVPLLAALSYRLQRQWVFPEPAAAAALPLRP